MGYLEPELRALGVPMAGRGARADEYLAAMRSLWEDEAPSFSGSHVQFDGLDAHPRPLQSPLPVVIGGHSPAAHRRAARHGDGWYGFLLGLRAMAEQRESLRRAVEEAGRERPLHIAVSPARPLDEAVVDAYAELGVERLIVVPRPGLSLDELLAFVERNAPPPSVRRRPRLLGERQALFHGGPLGQRRGECVRGALRGVPVPERDRRGRRRQGWRGARRRSEPGRRRAACWCRG